MIDKILEINNYSRFNTKNMGGIPNNGHLKKINGIYAPNGTGKTSLALLFQSLSNKNSNIILKKDSVLEKNSPEISLIMKENNKEYKESFNNKAWQSQKLYPDIKVFNSYYVNNNVYTFTLNDDNFILKEFLLKEDYGRYDHLLDKMYIINKKIHNIKRNRHNFRHNFMKKKNINVDNINRHIKDNEIYKKYNSRINENTEIIICIYSEIEKLIKKAIPSFISYTNKIMSKFTENISVADAKLVVNHSINFNNNIKFILVFTLDVLGYKNPKDRDSVGFDYTLSDGDKSALSLASFFARLNISSTSDDKNKTIIIDDPFNSFDTGRKEMTINLLSNIAKKFGQIVLLTHDKDFLFDFYENTKFIESSNFNMLQIMPSGKNVSFKKLQKRSKGNSIAENVEKLNLFLKRGPNNDSLIDILRMLRPLIEDIFKIKFPEFFLDGTWLSTYIKYIEKSKTNDHYKKFYKLYEYISDFYSLLKYTSKYHHSTYDDDININELNNFVKLTLFLFDKI
ncbi:AAA family ATPase [Apilactobacillus ozensis]|nr:AAA family ATPase [Apilactobacillus ozensis]